MSDIYARPDLTRKVRYYKRTTEEREEREVDIYESADNFRNDDHGLGTQEVRIENVTIQHNGGLQRRSVQVVPVALGLLCLLLVAGIIGLAICNNSVIVNSYKLLTERDQLNIRQNQLQTSYDHVTRERDQLQTSYDHVTRERDQLQTEVNKLKDILCTPGWKRFGSSCYYISTEMKTWQSSREDCLGRGAHLVVITSTEEQEFIRGLNVMEETWIGLKCEQQRNYGKLEVKWKLIDGTPLTAQYWGHGEASKTYSWYCATQLNGTWRSDWCGDTKYWMCEKRICS